MPNLLHNSFFSYQLLILAFFLMPFTEISSQNFTIEPIRIEYINPDTHKLTTLTEGLCDIKAVELSRVDN